MPRWNNPNCGFQKGNQYFRFKKTYKHTKETKRKIGLKHKGMKHSDESKKRMSEVKKGIHYSPKTEFKKGCISLMKGKKHSLETRLKISINRKGKMTGINHPLYGKKHSFKTLKKMSLAHKGKISHFKNKKNPTVAGSKNGMWKGGKIKYANGYIFIYSPNHPNNVKNYVLEHRLIIEKILGRYLTKKEFVHHKNGIKDDNRPKNLEIVTRQHHYGKVICPYCNKKFKIE